MKVCEVVNLIGPNDFDRRGSKMKLPSMYTNKNFGKASKVTPQTVTVKSSGKDGKVYGRRTIMQKESFDNDNLSKQEQIVAAERKITALEANCRLYQSQIQKWADQGKLEYIPDPDDYDDYDDLEKITIETHDEYEVFKITDKANDRDKLLMRRVEAKFNQIDEELKDVKFDLERLKAKPDFW